MNLLVIPAGLTASCAAVAQITGYPINDLSTLGAAGLMGAMWLWERRQSSKRDEQLSAAHERILSDKVQLAQIIQLVEKAASAMEHIAGIPCAVKQREIEKEKETHG